MRITILKANPPPATSFAALTLGLIGLFILVIGFGSEGTVADRAGYFVGSAVVIGLGFMAGRSHTANRARQARQEAEWAQAAEAEVRRVGNLTQLEPIEVRVSLQKTEECYWQGEATWYEYRSTVRRVNYHGPMVSIPIAKGIRYRAGSLGASIERNSELVPIDHGTMYITSKRVFFDGHEKNTSIAWSGLAGVQLFRGGLILEKNAGKSPHLSVHEGTETAAALIARQL